MLVHIPTYTSFFLTFATMGLKIYQVEDVKHVVSLLDQSWISEIKSKSTIFRVCLIEL